MISVKRSRVPAFLHASAFYQSLNEDDDEEIAVHRTHMKANSKVTKTADLVHLLSTARFWGLDELPDDTLHYAMYSADAATFVQVEEFEDAGKTVEALQAIRFAEGEQKMHRAAEYGRIDFFRCLLGKGNVLRFGTGVQAATHGQLACLEFITENLEGTPSKHYKEVHLINVPITMDVECWKHLHQHGAKLERVSVTKAAEAGNFGMHAIHA